MQSNQSNGSSKKKVTFDEHSNTLEIDKFITKSELEQEQLKPQLWQTRQELSNTAKKSKQEKILKAGSKENYIKTKGIKNNNFYFHVNKTIELTDDKRDREAKDSYEINYGDNPQLDRIRNISTEESIEKATALSKEVEEYQSTPTGQGDSKPPSMPIRKPSKEDLSLSTLSSKIDEALLISRSNKNLSWEDRAQSADKGKSGI